MKVSVVCCQCGCTFNKNKNAYNQSIKRGYNHFCSHNCSIINRTIYVGEHGKIMKKQKNAELSKRWRKENIDYVRKFDRKRYFEKRKFDVNYKLQRKEYIKKYSKVWTQKNKEAHRIITKKYNEKKTKELSDSYVLYLMSNIYELNYSELKKMPELITAYKLILSIKRIYNGTN